MAWPTLSPTTPMTRDPSSVCSSRVILLRLRSVRSARNEAGPRIRTMAFRQG